MSEYPRARLAGLKAHVTLDPQRYRPLMSAAERAVLSEDARRAPLDAENERVRAQLLELYEGLPERRERLYCQKS